MIFATTSLLRSRSSTFLEPVSELYGYQFLYLSIYFIPNQLSSYTIITTYNTSKGIKNLNRHFRLILEKVKSSVVRTSKAGEATIKINL